MAWKSSIRRGQSVPADWPCLVYALFMPCLCLVCGYGVICEAAMSCRRRPVRWRVSMAAAYHGHPSYLLLKPDIAYRGGVIPLGLGNDGHKTYASLGQNTLMGIEMRISL